MPGISTLDSGRVTIWTNALQANAYAEQVGRSLTLDVSGLVTFGAKLRFNRISAIETREYVVGQDITIDNGVLIPTDLEIDHQRYFAVQLDKIDATQVPVATIGAYALEGGQTLAFDRDEIIWAEMLDGADPLNAVAAYDLTVDGSSVYQFLTRLTSKLVSRGYKRGSFYAVGNDTFISAALNDPRVIPPTAAGDGVIASGNIARLAGFDLFESASAQLDGTVIAGTRNAVGFAAQIEEVDITPKMERRFASLVKGLDVYGVKVLRPDALAVGTFVTE